MWLIPTGSQSISISSNHLLLLEFLIHQLPHHSPCLQSVAFTFPGCRQKGARGGGLAALEQLTNMASTPKNMTPPNTGRVAKKGWKQQERNPYMGYISLLSGYTIHSGIYIDHVWIKLISQRGEVKIIEDCPGLSQDPSWPEPFLETSIFRHGCLALMGWHRRAWDDQSSPPPWCLQR